MNVWLAALLILCAWLMGIVTGALLIDWLDRNADGIEADCYYGDAP